MLIAENSMGEGFQACQDEIEYLRKQLGDS